MAKILVVEDEKSLRTLYRKDLESDGYLVVTAPDGAEALALFEREAPDLVVLDVRLPRENGLTTLGRLFGIRRRVPVVLNTGFVSYRDEFASWAADAFVLKSSDTEELRAKIRELIGTGVANTATPASPVSRASLG